MGKDQELLEAARKGNTAVVEKILSQRAKRSGPLASLRRGPGANVQDSSGYSALHHASLNGHPNIVRLLLEHDASPNIVDIKGSSPLHLAAWSGNLEIVKLILSGPAICNVNLMTKDDETALHCAAQYGHTAVVSVLLEHACDPGIRNCKGETALELAAQYGRLETVELLVRTDPMLIQRTTPDIVFPHTPLHLASRNGHKAVVEVLLRAGFNVNMRTKSGTALHEAALCGKVEVVRTLLEHGVNTSIRDINNYTVMDLLSQFNNAQAAQEIIGLLKRHKRGLPLVDSDGESINQPFPTVPNTDSDLGSPYENVRPSSKNARSVITDPSPSSSPHRWDYQRFARPPEGFEDRRVSGVSELSIFNSSRSISSNKSGSGSAYREDDYMDMRLNSLFNSTRSNSSTKTVNGSSREPNDYLNQRFNSMPTRSSPLNSSYRSIFSRSQNINKVTPLDGISFEFTENLDERRSRHLDMSSSFNMDDSGCCSVVNSESSRDSDNSYYQVPSVPRQFMDTSAHSEDLSNYLSCSNREFDQISVSSAASSLGYGRRPDSGGMPLYIPMNKGAHSPGSGSKVSPTPPKKPPRRTVNISPTHIQPMSASVDGVSNGAYEYLFLAHSGTRSQNNLNEYEKENRRDRLSHGHSMDQYVEMNVFNIALDDDPIERPRSELQRGKSEDLDNRKKPEPVAITSLYENMLVKQQNPRRKLRRNNDAYEEYTFKRKESDAVSSSSAPEHTFISSAYITITGNGDKEKKSREDRNSKGDNGYPLSPTHYNQPPTPEHPPPSAMQAECIIYDKIRPLSQEYKRRSRDMETETEEEFLLIGDHESICSFSSSVSLSDRSVDNILEEYTSDTPYSGLIKGSGSGVLESLNMNIPAVRPKTLKKLKRVYDNSASEDLKSDNEISSSSEKESDNKENRESKGGDRMSALSPFDEQEEWAKIQEIMASFGTGLVRESVFVAELEKEFQNRLMTISCSQNSLSNVSEVTVEKWLDGFGMREYAGLFMANGFDDLGFLNGVIEENDLTDMGISSKDDRTKILEAVKQLPLKIHNQIANCNNNNEQNLVKVWLKKINLAQYQDTFDKHLYHDMERIKRIWDVELSAVLDIEKVGHRKRILASVSNGDNIVTGPKMEDISTESVLLKTSSQPGTEVPSPSTQSTHSTCSSNTGTIRHRHKKSRPAPQPPVQKPQEKKNSEIFVGGSNSIKSQWRHQPILLITGSVKYSANYWGSTSIKEFKGTESTKKSIQKVVKSKEHFLEEILLSISYKGVKFINPLNQNTICEHEIVNMNCACQDTDHQAYFAYITKDSDLHYCHVFQAHSPEHATEIILTLGQAFELAYQMALRDHVTNKCKSKADQNRELNKPAVSPGSVSSHSRDFRDSTKTADMKLNGHPLKIMPLTLSIAAEPGGSSNTQNKTPTRVVTGDFSA
ncbi:ankyrin repeat and SAM domain-containing protein 1A-like [Anthonomus grandis grandis]|uniref:ankyrin repeat and SAM domain-containing protein 1A-like n=1 Tax=Anthonomus grandis grandis TaxID=2921223 RepID=UPI002164F1A3|nr:ankyrin repeat and SAM domain-containing protein 1A-like [Anthonomus grandis grandis]